MRCFKLDGCLLLVVGKKEFYFDGAWFKSFDKFFSAEAVKKDGVELSSDEVAQVFSDFLTAKIEPFNMHYDMCGGGAWVSACRSWIQRNVQNGENVIWGSDDKCEHMTVRKLEDMALEVGQAAILEFVKDNLL